MKELIPLGDHIKKQTPTIDSREVAEIFESNHKDVLKAIRRIIERSGYSKDSARRDFTLTHYKDQSNRKQPCYSITQKGLMALVMRHSRTNRIIAPRQSTRRTGLRGIVMACRVIRVRWW